MFERKKAEQHVKQKICNECQNANENKNNT